MSDEAMFERWRAIFAQELNDVAEVVRRLESAPASVSREEVTQALGWARELERLLFARRLQDHRGEWVAVRGNRILSASPDRAKLVEELRRAGRHGDLIFRVGEDEKVEV